jgi:hypothetical protein
MASVACALWRNELVVVILSREYRGHMLVGKNPVVKVIVSDFGIEEIASSHPGVTAPACGDRPYPDALDRQFVEHRQ